MWQIPFLTSLPWKSRLRFSLSLKLRVSLGEGLASSRPRVPTAIASHGAQASSSRWVRAPQPQQRTPWCPRRSQACCSRRGKAPARAVPPSSTSAVTAWQLLWGRAACTVTASMCALPQKEGEKHSGPTQVGSLASGWTTAATGCLSCWYTQCHRPVSCQVPAPGPAPRLVPR